MSTCIIIKKGMRRMTEQEKRIFKAHLKKDILDIITHILTIIFGTWLGVNYIVLGSIGLGIGWVFIAICHLIFVTLYFKRAYNATKNIMIDVEALENDKQLSNISRY